MESGSGRWQALRSRAPWPHQSQGGREAGHRGDNVWPTRTGDLGLTGQWLRHTGHGMP